MRTDDETLSILKAELEKRITDDVVYALSVKNNVVSLLVKCGEIQRLSTASFCFPKRTHLIREFNKFVDRSQGAVLEMFNDRYFTKDVQPPTLLSHL